MRHLITPRSVPPYVSCGGKKWRKMYQPRVQADVSAKSYTALLNTLMLYDIVLRG